MKAKKEAIWFEIPMTKLKMMKAKKETSIEGYSTFEMYEMKGRKEAIKEILELLRLEVLQMPLKEQDRHYIWNNLRAKILEMKK